MEHAFGKGVVLATPTNLWASSRRSLHLEAGRADRGRQAALRARAQVLYRRIVKLAEHASRLGRSLERSVKSYNAFAGSLENSRCWRRRASSSRWTSLAVQIPRPAPIEDRACAPLTSGDFEAIADLGRDELELEFDAIDAEIVEDGRHAG